jgi:hypothetical protein
VKKTLPIAALLFLGACAKNIQNEAAVKAGVLDYLQERSADTGLNMAAMEVTVKSLSFEKDTARANVSFHVKGMPDGAGMAKAYVLDRRGDKWIVNKVQSGAVTLQTPDGQTQALPGGALPPGQEPAGGAGGALPPGHPPAGATGGALPPGHPPAQSQN